MGSLKTKNLIVGVFVVLATLGGGIAVAPAASATHNCGIDFCPHIEDVLCLKIVTKFFPQLCPYS